MKTNQSLIAASLFLLAACLVTPASAQLGDLLGDDTAGDVLGGDTGDLVDLDTSDGEVGVPGIATVSVSSNDSGTDADAGLLGGDGESINVPLGELLGDDSDADVNLPGFAGLGNTPNIPGLPGPGGPGAPGAPGAPGSPGFPGVGINGGNGINGINGTINRGGSGGMNAITVTSSRLKMLLRIMQNRAWLRFAQGNKVCLPAFGVASVGTWLKQSDRQGLQQILAAYGAEIQALQDMMARCRNGQRQAVNIGQVIGVDLKADGTVVVLTL